MKSPSSLVTQLLLDSFLVWSMTNKPMSLIVSQFSDVMEIVDPRAARLTNYEVLRFMREQKAEIGSKSKEAKEKGKGKPKVGRKYEGFILIFQVIKNLVTVTLEATQYLEEGPAARQEEHHLRELAENLGVFCQEQVRLLDTSSLTPN